MSKKIAVAGASGLVGANIVQRALGRGYTVTGAMRDPEGPGEQLYRLPKADGNLTLLAADMDIDASFDPVVDGADGLFIACLIPVYAAPDGTPARELDDERGLNEVIMPTVNGCLNIMRSAIRAGVKTIVIGSSTSSTNPVPPVPVKNEMDHWSDENQQMAEKKYTSAAKVMMEKAAFALASEHDVRLSVMLPTLMLGPMVLPRHGEEGFMHALREMLQGRPGRHTMTPNGSTSMAHIHDVADLFLAAYEDPAAHGRYYAVRESWHWNDIYAELKRIEPSITVPEPFTGTPEPPTRFDFTRQATLGVKMRDIPEILEDAVAWVKGADAYPG